MFITRILFCYSLLFFILPCYSCPDLSFKLLEREQLNEIALFSHPASIGKPSSLSSGTSIVNLVQASRVFSRTQTSLLMAILNRDHQD